MARKIKLPLDMGNDIKVRDIDELKENYNSEKVVEAFLNGELLPWLRDRYYDEEADGVEALSADSDNIAGKLAEIFGVHIEGEVDVDEIAERNERLEHLRKITSDDEVLRNVDLVAFSQEDMDIVDKSDIIYLCGDKFRIPYSVQGKTYIGVNDPVVDISSSGEIDLESRHIVLKNCILSDNTKSRMKAAVTDKAKPEVCRPNRAALEYPDLNSMLKTVSYGGFGKDDVKAYIYGFICRINVLLGYKDDNYPFYENSDFKIVSFSGYDKKDVLSYTEKLKKIIDELEKSYPDNSAVDAAFADLAHFEKLNRFLNSRSDGGTAAAPKSSVVNLNFDLSEIEKAAKEIEEGRF